MASEDHNVPAALYHAALGKIVLSYIGRVHPTIIANAMEGQAIQTLEAIRCVLENDHLDDADCCKRVEKLVGLFFQELGVKIDRHSGLD